MPDYGERLPPYFSGRLPKGILGNAPYGWTQQAPLSTDNTPFNAYFPAGGFVYERLDWAKFKQQLNSSVASHGMMIGASCVVEDPVYVPAEVTLTVYVLPSFGQASVRTNVRNAIAALFDFTTVSFGSRISIGDVFRAAMLL